MTRSYLFLQGVCSPFFSRLGERLRAGGAAVSKVNFTAGDAAYWRNGEARAFRGRAQALPAFYAAAFAERGATDIVLFGDRRPNAPAGDRAGAAGRPARPRVRGRLFPAALDHAGARRRQRAFGPAARSGVVPGGGAPRRAGARTAAVPGAFLEPGGARPIISAGR